MTEEMTLVPKLLLSMTTTIGFMIAVRSIRSRDELSLIDAYETAEELHEKYFGHRKYSEYQSFYVMYKRKKPCHK
jgi:hypothetical protein|tara:strand:- start:379 stop:603 length:225 start_codon:yes stop_codon:yes gene_type:complete